MWENAVQMQIVSLNWWQYSGRVWSHANSAQPPNSHLAPKLKINAAYWNNSIHISGTWMVQTDIRLPNWRIICIRRRGAEMKQIGLIIWSSWRFSRGVESFIEPRCFLWCGRPVSRLCHKILLMHLWDTPSILATSRWELLSADNLTIRCSICCGKIVGHDPLLKIQRNINSLYRNPTLHKSIKVAMARQTSFPVTTPELTFFTFSGVSVVPRDILIVFGHSIWLCNGSMKSTVFRSAVIHTTRNFLCDPYLLACEE